MPNTINFTPNEKIMEGLKVLHDAVTSSLGPKGQNTIIDRGYEVIALHDGVSIARSILLKDREQDAAVRILREAAQRQVSQVGDGTTVVISLAYAVVQEAMKMIATGVHPMDIRKGLEEARDILIKEIQSNAIPVKTRESAVEIATISAEDTELGRMIGELLWDIGIDGVVTVEETRADQTTIERQEGMQWDRGYISSYFVTDPTRMEATVEEPSLFITDMLITDIHEILPFLDKVGKLTRNLVVIAPDVTASALETFVATKVGGGMNLLAVRAPLFEDKQKAFLQDIAILTGGSVATGESGVKFANLSTDILGHARRVTSSKDATLIVGGKGTEESIKDRIDSIKAQIKDSASDFDIKKLQERLAKLTSGVAIIKVGGHTEVEMKERKERAEDAKEATKAAMRSGIVPGGETIYLKVRSELNSSPSHQILFNACAQPFKKLISNAGLDSGQILERIQQLDGKIDHVGYDVVSGEVKDLLKAGIVDPADVSIHAIQNAVSVALMLIASACLITPIIEEKK